MLKKCFVVSIVALSCGSLWANKNSRIDLSVLPVQAQKYLEETAKKAQDNPDEVQKCAQFAGTWKGVCYEVEDGALGKKTEKDIEILQNMCQDLVLDGEYYTIGGDSNVVENMPTMSMNQNSHALWFGNEKLRAARNTYARVLNQMIVEVHEKTSLSFEEKELLIEKHITRHLQVIPSDISITDQEASKCYYQKAE